MSWKYKPGETDAVLRGCQCPIKANKEKGRMRSYITNPDCPLHGKLIVEDAIVNAIEVFIAILVWVVIGMLLASLF